MAKREELLNNLKQAQDEETAAKAAVVSADADYGKQNEIVNMTKRVLELSTSTVNESPTKDDDTMLSSLVAAIAIADKRLAALDDIVKAARLEWNNKRDVLATAQTALQENN